MEPKTFLGQFEVDISETPFANYSPTGWALFEMLENGMPLTSKVLAIPDICTPNELHGIVRVPDDHPNGVAIWDLLDTPEIQTPLKIYKPTDPEVIEGLRKIFNQAQIKQGTP